MRLVVICALTGCASSVSTPGPGPSTREQRSRANVPRAPYVIVPAELADAGIVERIRHRVLVRWWSAAWSRTDGDVITGRGSEPSRDVVPVIDDTATMIRVVVEDDKARMALWIARKDAWLTALIPFQLEGITAWLDPGIAIEAQPINGARYRVVVNDDLVSLEGWAPRAQIGQVWIVPLGDTTPTSMRPEHAPRWSPPHDARPLIRIAALTSIAQRPGGAVIAKVKGEQVVVAAIERGPAWTEIELARPHLRVRGFVATSAVLGTADDHELSGSGTGHGFGMSHATQHQIPAGTCLFDRIDGEVIGVQLETEIRLGGRFRDDNAWAMVYVDTPWDVVSMYVHHVGDDSTQPSWDSCTEAAHRR